MSDRNDRLALAALTVVVGGAIIAGWIARPVPTQQPGLNTWHDSYWLWIAIGVIVVGCGLASIWAAYEARRRGGDNIILAWSTFALALVTVALAVAALYSDWLLNQANDDTRTIAENTSKEVSLKARLDRIEARIQLCLGLAASYAHDADYWLPGHSSTVGPSSSQGTRAARAASIARELELAVGTKVSTIDDLEALSTEVNHREAYEVVDLVSWAWGSQTETWWAVGKKNPAC